MSGALEEARRMAWYHTLELPGHTTQGAFDLRPLVGRYGIPERLDGHRVLEVGTWDGFWAFELERRGAEVVALDLDDHHALDWPPRRRPAPDDPGPVRGQGFALAAELLGSKVRRVVRSIYDAHPDELGTFDLVFCGSVLVHLRDQLLALERMAALTRPGGMLISAEQPAGGLVGRLPMAVSRYRADVPADVVFWLPNRRAWRRMVWTAGYDRVVEHGRFRMPSTLGYSVPHVVLHGHRAP
jgi:tRNA (mo5U34)-methyltransferase